MYTLPMPRTPRKTKQIAARLTEEGDRLLSLMASDKGVSKSAILEMAIRIMAKTEGYASGVVYDHTPTPGHIVNER